MKKFLLVLVAVGFFAVGCQTDNTSDNAVNVGDGTTLTISLPQTRTSLGGKVGDTYPIYWSEGDKIVVNGSLSEKVCIDVDDNSRAKFVVNPSPEYPYHITYPYCASTSAEQAVVEFPAEQAYTEGTFAPNCAPMCGYAEKKSKAITLKHLASVLRIPVKAKFDGAALEKVVLTAENSVTGEYNVDCQNAAITATENVGNVVTYTLPANFALSSSTESVLHIVLPAVEVGVCTIEFIEKGGEKMVATWAPSTSLSKGVVREFKTVTYAPKTTTVLTSFEAVADEFEIFYENIKGYVRYTDGSPIAGVAMSDGFQVVKTDVNGYYEMSGVTPETWYIYCSLPADVKVPIDDLGRPGFFQKYEVNKYQYDFEFEKLPNGPEEEFIIVAMADTQPTNTTIIERFRIQAAPEIKSYSKSLNLPCYGVVLGDLVGSKPTLMEPMRDELAYEKMGMPVFTVMGNHDHISLNSSNPVFPDKRNSTFYIKIQRGFEECFGPVNYSFNRGNVHIIGMRDVLNTSNISVSDYTTGFTREQYEWLQQDLALVPKDKMVVLCVHIPIYNRGKVGDGYYTQEILNLLDQYAEAHILSGHTHYMSPYDHNYYKTGHKIYEHCISATRPDMIDSNIHRDGSPNGYAILHAKESSFIDWYYKGYPYGMNSRNDQIRLYRGATIVGKEPTESDSNSYGTMGFYQLPFDNATLLANIFTSDPSWTVEASEDGGKTWSKMEHFYNINYSEYTDLQGSGTQDNPWRVTDGLECSRDFWAIGILFGHLGSSVGNNYNRCSTMWKYTLQNPDTAQIKVRATDSHSGYVYTEDKIEDGVDLEYAFYDSQYNPPIE
ncbi:MAG: hypothetical protein E7129_03700 [Rikenellaceae bacterium]|nr:hypothetical protein [Rikenellaceae bacterium]